MGHTRLGTTHVYLRELKKSRAMERVRHLDRSETTLPRV